jgi:hypothetical protein
MFGRTHESSRHAHHAGSGCQAENKPISVIECDHPCLQSALTEIFLLLN